MNCKDQASINDRLDDLRTEMAEIGGLCDLQISRALQMYEHLWVNKIIDHDLTVREIAAEIIFTWANKLALASGISYQVCLMAKERDFKAETMTQV